MVLLHIKMKNKKPELKKIVFNEISQQYEFISYKNKHLLLFSFHKQK